MDQRYLAGDGEGRSTPATGWLVAGVAEFDAQGSNLVWTSPPGHLVVPRPGIAERFAGLSTGKRILSFAREYGPLGTCSHGFVGQHRGDGTLGNPGLCWQPLGPEPLTTWRYWIQRADAIRALTGMLVDGLTAIDDKRDVLSLIGTLDAPAPSMEPTRDRAVTAWLAPLKKIRERTGWAARREALAGAIQDWVALAAVRHEVAWYPSPGVVVRADGVFAAVGLELLYGVTGDRGSMICDGCAEEFTLWQKHRPQAGRRKFCRKCHDTGRGDSLRHRDWVRRRLADTGESSR